MTLKAGMADALRTIIAAGRLADARGREHLGAALAVLFGATADAGITRPDLDVDDVLMTLAGIGFVADRTVSREQAERMLDVVFEACVRTRVSSPATSRPGGRDRGSCHLGRGRQI
ncbi:MAG: hypothetical protein H0V08_05795 [Thermoleophilaceae bacterium]|nr:hypothetical protein [Thermoleophilaceae bacterium]